MQETEQEKAPETVEYDMTHFAVLKDAAIKKGWTMAQLADRLDEEEHVRVTAIRDQNNQLEIISLKHYTDVIHHKILAELGPLQVAPLSGESRQQRIDGIIAGAELRGISSARVAEQWRKCDPDIDMLERIVNKMDRDFGEPKPATTEEQKQRTEAYFASIHQDKESDDAPKPVEPSSDQTSPETALASTAIPPVDSAADTAASGAPDVAEEVKPKGRKKAEPKPPKAKTEKAETIIDGEVVIGRDENPKNFIAHSWKKREFEIKLALIAGDIEENYSDKGIINIRLYSKPEGVFFAYEIREADEDTKKSVNDVLEAVCGDQYAANRKCYKHIHDYIFLQNRHARDVAAIKADSAAVVKDFDTMKEKREANYGYDFKQWVKNHLDQDWNKDGHGDYRTKTIKTLAGNIEVKTSGGITGDRAKIDTFLFELREKASKNIEDASSEEEAIEITKARDTLDAMPVQFVERPYTEAVYNLDEMKALHSEAFPIDGIEKTEKDEFGNIMIKPSRATAAAK